MWLRLLVAAIASAVLAAAIASEVRPPARRAAPGGQLLAVAGEGSQRRLVAVDARSLRTLPSRHLRLPAVEGWARAPGGAPVAIVTDDGSRLRFVDPGRMRLIGRLPTGARGAVALVTWPSRDRLWLVLARPGCCGRGTTTVVTVDPVGRRVLAHAQLAGGLTRAAATPDGPVLLLAPSTAVGAATLVTVDVRGRPSEIALDGVSAGVQLSDGPVSVRRVRRPGLAVDPSGRRAYVLSARPYVLEVDLRARRVHHHGLSPRRSLGDRLRDLFEGQADARPRVGPERSAAWLAPRYIAVSGRDAHVSSRPDGAFEESTRPAGLQLIDTETWSVHTLDPRTAEFQIASGLLVTTGTGGLHAYRADGRSAFRLLEGRNVAFEGAAGRLGFVRVDRAVSLTVVDLARGRVVAAGPDPSPRPLAEDRGPWD